jgi:tetratricopeptide (TPR) repeat protein
MNENRIKGASMSYRIKRILLITGGIFILALVLLEIFVVIPVARQAQLSYHYPTFRESLDAARRNPKDAAAQRGFAWYYQRQGNLPQAEFHWRQAVRFQPESRESLYMLALVLQEEKKTSEALQLFRRIAAKDQTNSYGKTASAMAWYLSQNDLPKAERHWRQVVRLDPENREALYSLALILRREKKRSEALQICQRLAAKDKTDIYGQYAVTMIEKLSRQIQKASHNKG